MKRVLYYSLKYTFVSFFITSLALVIGTFIDHGRPDFSFSLYCSSILAPFQAVLIFFIIIFSTKKRPWRTGIFLSLLLICISTAVFYSLTRLPPRPGDAAAGVAIVGIVVIGVTLLGLPYIFIISFFNKKRLMK